MSYGSLNASHLSNAKRYSDFGVDNEDFVEITGQNFRPKRKNTFSWRQTSIVALCLFAVVGVFYAKPSSWSSSAEKEMFKGSPSSTTSLFGRVQQKKREVDALLRSDAKNLFDSFKESYSRGYESEAEEEMRFNAFRKNLDMINKLNERNKYAIYGINNFADITEEERRQMRMSQNFSLYRNILDRVPSDILENAPFGVPTLVQDNKDGMLSQHKNNMFADMGSWITVDDCAACRRYPEFAKYNYNNMPENFDWRTYYETPVKNQGGCGSCWTFSTVGDVEGKWFLATGISESLAPQQLVACDQNPGLAEGCNGGFPLEAFQYISKTGGIVPDEAYPYDRICSVCGKRHDTPVCDVDLLSEYLQEHDVAHVGAWQFVALGEKYEKLLALALLKNGPISILVNAYGMEYYQYGIADDTEDCNPESLDHAVLLVGFGVEDGVPYFLIKNSWGESWGEKGYFRGIRGVNYCGLSNFAVTSIVKEP